MLSIKLTIFKVFNKFIRTNKLLEFVRLPLNQCVSSEFKASPGRLINHKRQTPLYTYSKRIGFHIDIKYYYFICNNLLIRRKISLKKYIR